MLRALLRIAGALAVVLGAGLLLLSIAVGDCSAFGGACPRAGVNDDVIGTSFVAGALAGAGAVFAVRPSLRAWLRAVVVAIPVGLVAAVVAHTSTSS